MLADDVPLTPCRVSERGVEANGGEGQAWAMRLVQGGACLLQRGIQVVGAAKCVVGEIDQVSARITWRVPHGLFARCDPMTAVVCQW